VDIAFQHGNALLVPENFFLYSSGDLSFSDFHFALVRDLLSDCLAFCSFVILFLPICFHLICLALIFIITFFCLPLRFIRISIHFIFRPSVLQGCLRCLLQCAVLSLLYQLFRETYLHKNYYLILMKII